MKEQINKSPDKEGGVGADSPGAMEVEGDTQIQGRADGATQEQNKDSRMTKSLSGPGKCMSFGSGQRWDIRQRQRVVHRVADLFGVRSGSKSFFAKIVQAWPQGKRQNSPPR